ncbi:MAG: carboxypeptidase-like regulatory domain-containing protein, partial [Bacteroidota bacterium]
MRLNSILLILLANIVLAQDLSDSINIDSNTVTIGSLLEEIEEQSPYYFSYDPKKIPTELEVKLSDTSGTIEDFLKSTFKPLSVDYTLIGKNIILKRKKQNPDESSGSSMALKGQVIGAKNREALPFATIRIKGTSKGTIANADGIFELKESTSDQTILISFIGYKNAELSIHELGKELTQIELEEDVIALSEVEINPIDPVDVLSESLSKIRDNYPTDPFLYRTYYRELVKLDSSFIKFADAASDIYSPGYGQKLPIGKNPPFILDRDALPFPGGAQLYGSIHHFQVKINEARASDNLHEIRRTLGISDFDQFSISNGVQKMLGHDYVLKPLQFLAQQNWSSYIFELEDYIMYNNKRVYEISFQPKGGNIKKALVKGKIYVDISSSAIVGYEFEVPENLQKKLKKKTGWIKFIGSNYDEFEEDGLKRFKQTMSDYNHKINVQFQEYNGKWYLAYVKGISFYHNYGSLRSDIFFETISELVINEIVTEDVEEIPYSERFAGYLFDYPLEYNPKFWEEYPSMVPTGVYGKALSDLQKDKSLEEQFKSRVTKDTTLRPPVAEKIRAVQTVHDVELADDYAWLHNRKDKKVRQHINAENRYTNNYMIPLKKRARDLYKEMVYRVKKDDQSVPLKLGDYYYYMRFTDSLNYPIYCRKYQSTDAKEEIVQDVNKRAENYDYYTLYPSSPNPDHTI